ncbi:putative outer membrane protein, OMP85 family [Methylocaldum marinum]|uniref:Putative outer membrane protein, OMP85 family n=1 Tax=Methylocaldum marinum TaxID=1432792 RepID=A0A250KPW3_9GAMM|nr:hypothetical protein [Methylocaldum marinum]BBA33576.1 putative outer membrane protein, OMP85 family [Methylocaldum marinum]
MPSKAIPHIDSKVHALEGGISHPVINNLRRRLTLGASFAVRETETELLGESFSFVPGVESNGIHFHEWFDAF